MFIGSTMMESHIQLGLSTSHKETSIMKTFNLILMI